MISGWAKRPFTTARNWWAWKPSTNRIGVYSGLSEQDQVELLDSVIALANEDDLSLEELKLLYLSGDLAAIVSRMTQPAMRLGAACHADRDGAHA